MRDDASDRYFKRISPRVLESLHRECQDTFPRFQDALSVLIVRTFEAGQKYERKRIDAVREVSE